MITNHSRHGPLVVSQLRFSGPVPLNAVASMGQPTQLPLWASLLMLASRASSLCSIFLLVLRNWHSCLLEPRSFRLLLQLEFCHLATPQNTIHISTNRTSRLNEAHPHRRLPVFEAFPEQLRARDSAISVHVLDEFELLALVVTLPL